MDLVGSLSPLQRMASITNSLVSQPSLPGQPNSANRPNRACLPPITQQQFDRFSHLNTDEVVRRVSLFFLIFRQAITNSRCTHNAQLNTIYYYQISTNLNISFILNGKIRLNGNFFYT